MLGSLGNCLSYYVSASDPTIPAVAGTITGIVVIACIFVVVFLRRRQKL